MSDLSPPSAVKRKSDLRPARQQVVEIGLTHRQRQATQVLAVERQDVERLELHFVVVLA
jgi:hypothetical protein